MTLEGVILVSTRAIGLDSMNRETYLNKCVAELSVRVFAPAGHEVPGDVKVTCGWPSSRGMSEKTRTIGQCFPRSMSAASINEIFISPTIADSVEAMGILTHELVHAVDDCNNGHKAPFKRIAQSVGLTGKMTATTTGDELKAKLEAIAKKLGEYPHAEISTTARKKQSTRGLRIKCNDCGAKWRMARSWAVQVTCCPVCAGENLSNDSDSV